MVDNKRRIFDRRIWESFRASNLDPKKCPRAEPEAWTLRVVVDRR